MDINNDQERADRDEPILAAIAEEERRIITDAAAEADEPYDEGERDDDDSFEPWRELPFRGGDR